MNLTIIGSGGSIMSTSRSYPAFLINEEILLDCGEGTTQKLLHLDAIKGINQICLTHLHNDHFMGLFSLLWYYWLTKSKERITIIGPPNTEDTIEKIMELNNTPADMGDFSIKYIELKDSSGIQELKFNSTVKARKMRHGIPTFGYRIEDGSSALTYSGDTSPNQRLIDLARNSNILINESTFPDKFQERAHSYNHCTPSDAGAIAQKAQVKTLIMVHISAVFEDLIPTMKQSAAQKFGGKVVIGEDLMAEKF